jgi:hypothetical protein
VVTSERVKDHHVEVHRYRPQGGRRHLARPEECRPGRPWRFGNIGQQHAFAGAREAGIRWGTDWLPGRKLAAWSEESSILNRLCRLDRLSG